MPVWLFSSSPLTATPDVPNNGHAHTHSGGKMDERPSKVRFRWRPAVVLAGVILGAAVGLWAVWDFFFEGFSIGPPPPATPGETSRLVILNLCLKGVLTLAGACVGLVASALLVGLLDGFVYA